MDHTIDEDKIRSLMRAILKETGAPKIKIGKLRAYAVETTKNHTLHYLLKYLPNLNVINVRVMRSMYGNTNYKINPDLRKFYKVTKLDEGRLVVLEKDLWPTGIWFISDLKLMSTWVQNIKEHIETIGMKEDLAESMLDAIISS